jgi:formate-dependent phosphoribosylglycinamide formyltransferase (GAR transformylase)
MPAAKKDIRLKIMAVITSRYEEAPAKIMARASAAQKMLEANSCRLRFRKTQT